MLLRRLRKKASTGVAAEVCLEAELVEFKPDALTLEENDYDRFPDFWSRVAHWFEVYLNER